jgi:signal transduction histidine kinase
MRPKLFLIFALIFTAPLLLIGVYGFLTSLSLTRSSLQSELQKDLIASKYAFAAQLSQHQRELKMLATNDAIASRLKQTENSKSDNAVGPVRLSPNLTVLDDLRDALSPLLLTEKTYTSVAGFDEQRRLLWLAQPGSQGAAATVQFRITGFLHGQSEPDARIWTANERETVCHVVSDVAAGEVYRCAIAVPTGNSRRAVLVTDTRLDLVFAEVEHRAGNPNNLPGKMVIAINRSGKILYHTNDALKHQQVETSLPRFAPVAKAMMNGESGEQLFTSLREDEWLAVYSDLAQTGLSLAVARNYSVVMDPVKRTGWLGLALAGALGLGLATVLALVYQRRITSLKRVTEGVTAIAKGELDLHIDARSRDDMRALADGVNLMTERLREHLAREAETRQIESFVRFSAMVTHDLKNAIGGLSLLVSNMERHFDNESFRTEAMSSLTDATEKLKRLVDRISNPIATLSGEYRRPVAIDIVALIEKVLRETLGRTPEKHQLEKRLPHSLYALVDGERIEKVFENLVWNALEAMAERPGILTIAAGDRETGKIYISVGDTGVGMSRSFIENNLFHAFATTKKKGMGLGLYTCREVVRTNGGQIEVSSSEGAGTTFTVVLPSAPPETS